MAAAEALWVVLPCHLSSRLGRKILRGWSCCEDGRLSFSSDCFCVIEVVVELSSDRGRSPRQPAAEIERDHRLGWGQRE